LWISLGVTAGIRIQASISTSRQIYLVDYYFFLNQLLSKMLLPETGISFANAHVHVKRVRL